MILTCPECASSYFVDDSRVGSKGRTVRCASCSHAWRAVAPAAMVATVVATPVAVTSAPEIDDDADRSAPLPNRLRAEAMEKKKTRAAVAAGVGWAALGAGFIILILSAALFRIDIVRLWPQAASAYAFAKMPVNPTGLAIDTVQGQPNLIGGHAALSVTAMERNVETHTRPSIPLRVILYDKAGKRLISAVAAPPARDIQPGDTRPFAVNFIDPPSAGSSFTVEFAFDKVNSAPKSHTLQKMTHAKLGAYAAASLTPATTAPVRAEDAKPLPSNSPYALPVSATEQTTH